MSGVWTKQDQEWWDKPENRFVYYFNQIITSPKWQELFETRTPETRRLREEELKKIFLQSLNQDKRENVEQIISKLLQAEQPITESEAQDLAYLICQLPEIKINRIDPD